MRWLREFLSGLWPLPQIVALFGGSAVACLTVAMGIDRHVFPPEVKPCVLGEESPYVKGLMTENVQLRWQTFRQGCDIADLCAENARLRDAGRCVEPQRGAAEVRAGDKIPPQALPTMPAPAVAIPTPEELEVRLP